MGVQRVAPPPKEDLTAFFEREESLLTINAQGHPYNLPANVFFFTKKDLKRIDDDYRQIKGNASKLSEKDIEKVQKDFIRYLFIEAGIKTTTNENITNYPQPKNLPQTKTPDSSIL